MNKHGHLFESTFSFMVVVLYSRIELVSKGFFSLGWFVILVVVLLGQIVFYKGLHKVKVVTESEGYWIVEALEGFEDFLEGKKVKVTVGERRIVQPIDLHTRKVLAPPIPEHVYERNLEKKVKRIIEASKEKTK
jgi:hypothetical protein